MELEEILKITERRKRRRTSPEFTPAIFPLQRLAGTMTSGEKEGIECESSRYQLYQAAGTTLRRELTLPGVSQTLILTRIRQDRSSASENLAKLAETKATMVIFLSIHEIERWCPTGEGLRRGDTGCSR